MLSGVTSWLKFNFCAAFSGAVVLKLWGRNYWCCIKPQERCGWPRNIYEVELSWIIIICVEAVLVLSCWSFNLIWIWKFQHFLLLSQSFLMMVKFFEVGGVNVFRPPRRGMLEKVCSNATKRLCLTILTHAVVLPKTCKQTLMCKSVEFLFEKFNLCLIWLL